MIQETALNVLKTGANVFLTGEPGAGKTYVVNEYIAWLEACGVKVAVTATTGIAATHIGGMTIHSWSGIGAKDNLTPFDIEQITTREVVSKRIRKADVLVIDEISMMEGSLLDMVDRVTKLVRQNNEPFGGLQVVFVGDFYQLPPIVRRGDVGRYAFESGSWDNARPLTCYLTEQHRQEDEMFLGLLSSIRKGEIEDDHFNLLKEQVEIATEGVEPTRLYTHNADVDAVNSERLAKISGTSNKYKMSGQGNKQMIAGLVKSCLSPDELHLKIDAVVMFTKNNFEAGYVNGTLGRVVDFDGIDKYPIVETVAGQRILVKPASWSVAEDKRILAEVSQIPLRLAWAITIHKSQGMSLDAAEMDLSKTFVYGQGYVALSRVRSLAGLKLLGMNPHALAVDPKVIAKDEIFHMISANVEEEFAAMDDEEIETMHKQFVTAVGGRYTTEVPEVTEKTLVEKIKKISTIVETHNLLKEKKTIKEIIKERGVTDSTVWGHIEKIQEAGNLTREDIEHLVSEDWHNSYKELKIAMEKIGDELLRPLREETGEKYDYEEVRLARLFYRLK